MTGAILLEKFKASHFEDLRGEPSVASLLCHLTPASLAALESAPHAYTFLKNDKAIAAAGVAEYWPGRGEAWAIFSEEAKDHGITLVRMMARALHICPVRRIEAGVEIGFAAGHKLARALGFEMEAKLARAYTPGGTDCSIYARVGG